MFRDERAVELYGTRGKDLIDLAVEYASIADVFYMDVEQYDQLAAEMMAAGCPSWARRPTLFGKRVIVKDNP